MGLIAVPLGKKANISEFYYKVLNPLLWDFYPGRDNAINRRSVYLKAREAFLRQREIVKELKETIGSVCGFWREALDLAGKCRDLEKTLQELESNFREETARGAKQQESLDGRKTELQARLREAEDGTQRLREEKTAQQLSFDRVRSRKDEINQRIEENQKNLTGFQKLFHKEKYKTSCGLIEEYNEEKKDLREEEEKIRQALSFCESSLDEAEKGQKNAGGRIPETGKRLP